MENKKELSEEFKESLRLTLRDFFVILDWSCKSERDRFNFMIEQSAITIGYFEDYKLNEFDLESFKRLKTGKMKNLIMDFDNTKVEGPVDIAEQFIKNIANPINSMSGNCFMSIAMAKIDIDVADKFMIKNKGVFKSDELIQKFMENQKEALNFYIFMNSDIHVFMYSMNKLSNNEYIPDFDRDFIYTNTAFIIVNDNNIPVNSGNIDAVFKKEELPLFLVDL